ncbi:MAG TPA: MBL fold metallo-hydrolase [Phenylobacterium sp.]|nr:MBL fold metallo-hydrolase [Phenylobacterium sp.]
MATTLIDGKIRVRMYRVGFGDCFLLSLPKPGKGHWQILVDCGVHSAGDVGTIAKAVENLRDETGSRLDVIIATHAHQDHVAGFARCATDFAKMSVGEVWLPFTEDPADTQAVALRKKQLALMEALALHLAATGDTGEKALAAKAMIENARDNGTALRLLKTGLPGARVRYLSAGLDMEGPAGIEGLKVSIKGPPRDQAFLARMDPPKSDRYLAAGADGAIGAQNGVRPFPAGLPREAMPAMLRLSPEEEAALRKQSEDLSMIAFSIDQALNNSSIVALMNFGHEVLLFPGDAQYGNWASWLDDPNAVELLSQVTFFKVAHHGSHNATPRRVIEGLTQGGAVGMVSTQVKPWKSIPRIPLMEALDARTDHRWVRSDALIIAGAPDAPNVPQGPLAPGFAAGPFWYDYSPVG